MATYNKGGYYTRHKFPQQKTERRIKLPPIEKRPVRFQLRSLIRKEYIHKNPWWFVMHRRGPGGRPHVGLDALEARAVPHGLVRGTLPERILYAALVAQLHFVPDVDFDFQSSLQGGRIQFGGIVVDFLFFHLKLAIQVQGPTHTEYIRIKKDQEQMLALQEMGYDVVFIDENDIYDEAKFDQWLRKTFGWTHVGGMGMSASSAAGWETTYANIGSQTTSHSDIIDVPSISDVIQLDMQVNQALEALP